uniref:Uncharacterized protein n=1 Tax=Parascaris univalens TaxID=6257 RepID=A0A914ZSL2_PARUN
MKICYSFVKCTVKILEIIVFDMIMPLSVVSNLHGVCILEEAETVTASKTRLSVFCMQTFAFKCLS